jgi:hypothetical protein
MYIQFLHTPLFSARLWREAGKEISAICIRRPNTGGGLFSGNGTFTNMLWNTVQEIPNKER